MVWGRLVQDKMPPELSVFEMERQRRIQENKQRMAELGLLQVGRHPLFIISSSPPM